ncbi:hypothetical protein PtA15_13A343 [Puccinia triticina]|uniref:Secreted protein n=1 Tax=Puccinia triticina TaxID=208348 RepID=A0ABY7D2X1_9BASI|nr:uncharacterized protein PtA15_13A343 [Puccinia triticina]WAQ90943.1 hypothetical protein PtA15_13A343 [Puccinia triticina]
MKLVYYTTTVLALLIAMLHVNLVSSSNSLVRQGSSKVLSQGGTPANPGLAIESEQAKRARRIREERREERKKLRIGCLELIPEEGTGSSKAKMSPPHPQENTFRNPELGKDLDEITEDQWTASASDRAIRQSCDEEITRSTRCKRNLKEYFH